MDLGGAGKIRITIRLDSEVIDWFRGLAEARGGGNYQTMINNALRDYINAGPTRIEDSILRAVREIRAIIKNQVRSTGAPRE